MCTRICLALLIVLLMLSGSVLAQEGDAENPEIEEAVTLTIWWPDELALDEDNALHPILVAQNEVFLENEENLILENRLKPVGMTGGIISTLRSASNVAPSALPALTLLRRQDLLVAERAGLLESLEGNVASSIQGDLDTALALGQVNDVLYGVPYLLDLQHIVYRPQDGVNYSNWTYDDILEREIPFIFAASGDSGLSDIFFLQYLSSGGRLNTDSILTFNETALLTTLDFYEAASDKVLVNGFTLNYTSSDEYLNDFVEGNYDTAIFDSTNYLHLHQDDSDLQIATIPTASGEATTILNGWVWVLITTEEEEQAAAIRYLDWMMDIERQAEFAQAIYRIPSRRSALDLGLAGNASIAPYLAMLENPILPISESEAGSLGRLMQDALSSVLALEQTAEEATAYVLEEQEE